MIKLPKLSRREQVLATIVGGTAFLIFNLFVLGTGLRKQAELRAGLHTKAEEWEMMQAVLSQRELWAQREKWIQERQPKLQNESRAGAELLDRVKQAAQREGITLENPRIGTVEKTPHFQAITVNVEARADWAALIKLLHALQQPEEFIVVQSGQGNPLIRIDPEDNTKMRTQLRVSKWYAPAS